MVEPGRRTSFALILAAVAGVFISVRPLAAQFADYPYVHSTWNGPGSGFVDDDWDHAANWTRHTRRWDVVGGVRVPVEIPSGPADFGYNKVFINNGATITLGSQDPALPDATPRTDITELTLSSGSTLNLSGARITSFKYGAVYEDFASPGYSKFDSYALFSVDGATLNINQGTVLDSVIVTSNGVSPVYELHNRLALFGGPGSTIVIADAGTEVFLSEARVTSSSSSNSSLTVSNGATFHVAILKVSGQEMGNSSALFTGEGTLVTGVSNPWKHVDDEDLTPSVVQTDLEIGLTGNGEVKVNAGARFVGSSVVLGGGYNLLQPDTANGIGTLTISDVGSEVNASGNPFTFPSPNPNVIIGQTGIGVVTVTTGGTLSSTQNIMLGQLKYASTLGTPAQYEGDGTLQIGNGGSAGIVTAPGVIIGQGTGKVIFNHNESAYAFTPNITQQYAAGRDGAGYGSVYVRGGGRTLLGGNNQYIGGTYIENGILVANHTNALGGGPVIVQSQGVLEIAPTITQIHIGDSAPEGVGVEIYSSLQGGATLIFQVPALESSAALIQISGSLDVLFDPSNPLNLQLSLASGFDLYSDYDWTFLSTTEGLWDAASIPPYQISSLSSDAFAVNLDRWTVSLSDDFNGLVLHYAAIPEPSRTLLLALALTALLARRRR